MRTHYDTLGVVPAASDYEIRDAYKRLILGELERFPAVSSLFATQALDRTDTYTSAFHVIGREDKRKQYNLSLLRQGAICSLCEGKGFQVFGPFAPEMGKRRECIACKGSGKGTVVMD